MPALAAHWLEATPGGVAMYQRLPVPRCEHRILAA
jgi:hypothetical protein